MNSTNIDLSQYTDFKLGTIKAPKKKLYWFEHSGHSPNWEEPALFHERLVEVATECRD